MQSTTGKKKCEIHMINEHTYDYDIMINELGRCPARSENYFRELCLFC